MRFRQIYIEITNVCNLACPFCPGTSRAPAYMDAGMFAGIAQQVKPLTEQVYFHVMGEPLLHPEFTRFIEICASFELPVAIATNGTLFDTAAAESLLNPIVRQINVSLHSLQQLHSQADKNKQLKQILTFTKKVFETRPELYINYRLWNLNSPAEELDSGTNGWICRRVEKAFNVTIPSAGHSSGRKSRPLLNRLYLHLDTRFEWPDINSDNPLNTKGFCHALGTHFAVLADGAATPCCLDRDGVAALGNCRHQSILSIIDSPRAKTILAGFKNGILIGELCKKCTYCSRFNARLKKT
jgi:organic radical activating enzyme